MHLAIILQLSCKALLLAGKQKAFGKQQLYLPLIRQHLRRQKSRQYGIIAAAAAEKTAASRTQHSPDLLSCTGDS
jgi:hypothetical protein